MPQQVNLCLPILRQQQQQRFAAQSLAQALALVLLVGAALAAAWVWNLNQTGDSLKVTLAAQTGELGDLRAALERSRVHAGAGESALTLQLRQEKVVLQQRQSLLEALRQGLFQPGQGYSARLQLLAQSIPPVVWVKQIHADAQQLELSGYTLEPAALNDWVGKLSASALLQGQSLTTVQVDEVKAAKEKWPAASAGAGAPALWSFRLLSQLPGTLIPAKAGAGAP